MGKGALGVVLIGVLVWATFFFILSGGGVSIDPGGFVSVRVVRAQPLEPEASPAYQLLIPEDTGSETGLKPFPPKLEIGDSGKDNWLATSRRYMDVPVGTYTENEFGENTAVDVHSGSIYTDSLTNDLVITAGTLSSKLKYDIEVTDYSLRGGDELVDPETGRSYVTKVRGEFESYVSGSGSDLYELEDTPQRYDSRDLPVKAVKVYAHVRAEEGADKATAATRIWSESEKLDGTAVDLTTTGQRIVTEYLLNPFTDLPWTWEQVDSLQAGITLKTAVSGFVYVEIETEVHSQTFFPITPTDVSSGTSGAWAPQDFSSYIAEGATGAILAFVNPEGSNREYGAQKAGSTDNRAVDISDSSQATVVVGVNATRFSATYQETGAMEIWIIGYTMSGVTLKTNADPLNVAAQGFTDEDLSSEAPSATGVIMEVTSTSAQGIGARMNGSGDNRSTDVEFHTWVLIGSDGSQIVEIFNASATTDWFLNGYVTDGVTWNINGTDLSLANTDPWQDLPAALPANSVMGIFEVVDNNSPRAFGIRENGKSGGYYDNYYDLEHHVWWLSAGDASQIYEGQIEDTVVDWYVVGVATGEEAATDISNVPATYGFGTVTTSSTTSTGLTYFNVTNDGAGTINITIQATDFLGGLNWTLSDTATPGDGIAGLKAGRGGESYNITVKKTAAYNNLVTGLGTGNSQLWGLQLLAPTVFNDGALKESTITLSAVAS